MSRKRVMPAIVGCLLLILLGSSVYAQASGQLIVENRSGSDVGVYVWHYNQGHWDWTLIATVSPGNGMSISNAHENERYRAYLLSRREYRYHTVDFSQHDRGVDRWRIE